MTLTNKTFNQTSRLLMLAGIVPFILGTFAMAVGVKAWWIVDDVPASLALYSLAIASFMSGIHWGVAQIKVVKSSVLLFTNFLVLLPWVIFVVSGDGAVFYLSLAWVFFKQYLFDRELAANGFFSVLYLRNRRIVTSIVCLLMLACSVLSLL